MSTEVRVIRPWPFNCNDGPEVGLEVKGQTTTTYEPLSASGTPILYQVSPGHRKPATQPTNKTQHPRGHTTHTFNKATVVHATANLISCMGGETQPPHNQTHSTPRRLPLGPAARKFQ